MRHSITLCLTMVLCPLAHAQPAAEVQPPDVGAAFNELDPVFDAMGVGPMERMVIEAMLSEDLDPMLVMMLASMAGGGHVDDEAMLIGMLMKAARGPKAPQAVVVGNTLLIVEDGWVYRIHPDTLQVLGAVRYRQGNSAAAMLKALAPAVDAAREKAAGTSCLSNMKQVCLAAMMYHEDMGAFPEGGLTEALGPYVGDLAVFTCPSGVDAGVGYAMNKDLAGMNLAEIRAPAKTVLFFESVDPQARPLGGIEDAIACHDGRVTVGFADGHAQLLPPEELGELLKLGKPEQ